MKLLFKKLLAMVLKQGEVVELLAPTTPSGKQTVILNDSIANYRFLFYGVRQVNQDRTAGRWSAPPIFTTPQLFRKTTDVDSYGDQTLIAGTSIAWKSDTTVQIIVSASHLSWEVYGIR